jgi:hypothetical protein
MPIKKHNVCVLAEGYVYFDLFNQNVGSNPVRLISPTIKAVQEQFLCFTFWFAVFGAGESAQLRVVRQDNSSSDNGEPSPQEKAKQQLSLELYQIIIILCLLLFFFLLVNVHLTTLRSQTGVSYMSKITAFKTSIYLSLFRLFLYSSPAVCGTLHTADRSNCQ